MASIRNRQWCRPVLHLSANTEKPMGETPANVSSTSASHLSHHDVTLSTKVPFAPHLPVPSAPPRSVTVQHTATMKPLICSPGTQVFKFIYTVSTMFTDQQRIYMTIHKLLQVPQMLLIKSTWFTHWSWLSTVTISIKVAVLSIKVRVITMLWRPRVYWQYYLKKKPKLNKYGLFGRLLSKKNMFA